MSQIFDRICCSIVRTWLVPRAEGSDVPVPTGMLSWINGHLDTCKRCRVELKNLRLTTFALRRAARRTPLKTLDANFANRVIQRVKRGEDVRLLQQRQVRAAYAGIAATAIFLLLVGWLGGFNPLKAQWSSSNDISAVTTPPPRSAPPYNIHDPFQSPAGLVPTTANADKFGMQILEKPQLSAANDGIVRRPIPDLLSDMHNQMTAPKPVAQVIVVQQNSAPPTLVSSSYQIQDNRTVPAIIGAESGAGGLSLVTPAPSDPGAEQALPASESSAVTLTAAAATPNAPPAATQAPIPSTSKSATLDAPQSMLESENRYPPILNQK